MVFGSGGLDIHNAACGIETPIASAMNDNTASLDIHNAACGIETVFLTSERVNQFVSTYTMLRAALKPDGEHVRFIKHANVSTYTMLRAALKQLIIPPTKKSFDRLDIHNAACGIETRIALLVRAETSRSRHTQCCVRH